MDFYAWTLFLCFWTILVYCPVAHMVWHPDGLLNTWGYMDFAGGRFTIDFSSLSLPLSSCLSIYLSINFKILDCVSFSSFFLFSMYCFSSSLFTILCSSFFLSFFLSLSLSLSLSLLIFMHVRVRVRVFVCTRMCMSVNVHICALHKSFVLSTES